MTSETQALSAMMGQELLRQRPLVQSKRRRGPAQRDARVVQSDFAPFLGPSLTEAPQRLGHGGLANPERFLAPRRLREQRAVQRAKHWLLHPESIVLPEQRRSGLPDLKVSCASLLREPQRRCGEISTILA